MSEPSVSLSFANNFWGKDDAGVGPLLQRMHDAKTTCEELKTFYTARAAIEDEFARKLLALSKKPLGSVETGTLKISMDVLRAEVESMGKAHQTTADQMKTELEQPLTDYSGAWRERRRIVQGTCEKILQLKMKQTNQVNKTRDRYEQDCLKIKGYLAQGHMVMGQEERKNKARLEKTQAALVTSNAEYQEAIKALEGTTARWNKEWKQACDKFQDLEEERIDFLKASLWTFANVASTVCVSDDQSCEKVRVSLEDCEVEKDITSFILDRGTGQDIPGSCCYSEENYSVAQFPRAGNPTFRSASPNPSTSSSSQAEPEPEKIPSTRSRDRAHRELERIEYESQDQAGRDLGRREHDRRSGPAQNAPHNEYPLDGMTMYCRPGNMISDSGSGGSPIARPPSSHASGSDCSNPTSVSSGNEAPPVARGGGQRSPLKQQPIHREEKLVAKRKSGFFSNEQRRMEAQQQPESPVRPPPSLRTRSTWSPAPQSNSPSTSSRHQQGYENGSANRRQRQTQQRPNDEQHDSPEPIDPRASLALNVGGNIFDVAAPENNKGGQSMKAPGEVELALDPIAQALAELKGVTKGSAPPRNTADRFFGLATPAPAATPAPGLNPTINAAQRGTPPPNYAPKTSALGLPPPAFTSQQMQETTQRYVNQRDHMLDGPQMPAAGGEAPSRTGSGRQRARTMENLRTQSRQSSREVPDNQPDRGAASPIPNRSVSPRPQLYSDDRYRSNSPQSIAHNRSASPNPYTQSRPGTSNTNRGQYTAYSQRSPSPLPSGQEVALSNYRSHSPVPSHHSRHDSYGSRGRSQAGSVQGSYDGQSSRHSYYNGDNGSQVGVVATYQGGGGQVARPRSKSVVDTSRQYSRDGRPILHYARAMYVYHAAIPEELSFAKGDIVAVLRQQDDGWWEAEIVGVQGRPGLVPSNYLQNC
ncbi:hypothetical protein C7212DRAFT_353524 [Tuber magnatum]|uniref:SH3 domain-containing protein n=1 Tax=Tuber magnatum TaxID=42249 RepID=A0A317SHH3_9PEZI|nr:hypothetical protein C7212DRAFT_353524 [Tuber magnatum]